MHDPIEILKAARQRLIDRGWTTGTLCNPQGQTCALGAIALAAGWQRPKDGSEEYHFLEENGQAEAVKLLARAPSVAAYVSEDPIRRVYRFNDELGRIGVEVVEAFDEAIALAEQA